MTDPNSPLDSALDLLVFVPVGIAVTAAEELPKLAAKGRSRVEQQVAVARVVGQFAVAKGRVELRRRITRDLPKSGTSTAEEQSGVTTDAVTPDPLPDNGGEVGGSDPSGSEPAGSASEVDAGGSPTDTTSDEALTGSGAHEVADTGTNPPIPDSVESSQTEAPRSESLAIPGYDSLSASQVVQRLGGLSDEELAAVGAYEAAHRARQTVLARVSQLQLGRD